MPTRYRPASDLNKLPFPLQYIRTLPYTLLTNTAQIVKDVGLCISLWDVLEKGDEFFFPQDGAAFLKGL